MYFRVDVKNFFKNKVILILLAFLLCVMIFDPITVFLTGLRYENYFDGIGENMYNFWLLLNSASWGGELFNTLVYIFPVILTGMAFYREHNSSMQKLMVSRGGRKKYIISKMLSAMLLSFVLFLGLLLSNLLITSLLFTWGTSGIYPMFIPNEGSFAHALFVINPIYTCLFYTFLNAVIVSLLTGFCVGLHLVIRFPNIYIAMIVPIILIYVANYVFDSQFIIRSYSLNYLRQPAASYAMSWVFTFEHCFTMVFGWLLVDVVLLVVGVIRNRNIM